MDSGQTLKDPKLWGRLTSACGIRPGSTLQQPELLASVQPVLDAARSPFSNAGAARHTFAVTGTGTLDATDFPPAREVWRISRMVLTQASGTFTFNNVWLIDGALYVHLRGGTALGSLIVDLPHPITLRHPQTIRVGISSHASDGDLRLDVWREKFSDTWV